MDKQSTIENEQIETELKSAELEVSFKELIKKQENSDPESYRNDESTCKVESLSKDRGRQDVGAPEIEASAKATEHSEIVSEIDVSEEIVFEPNRSLVLAAFERFKQHERNIFALGALGAGVFTVIYTNVAAITLLYWISICFLIAKLNFFGCKYKVDPADSALKFSKKDLFGWTTLKIDWKLVERVTEQTAGSDRELTIKLKSNEMPMFCRWAYQDLFDYPLFVERIQLRSSTFASEQGYSLLLDKIANQCAERSITCKLLPLPQCSDLAISDKDCSAAEQERGTERQEVDSDSKLVTYNPQRLTHESRSKFLKKYELLITTLLIAIPAIAFLLQGLILAKLLVLLVIGLTAWICLNPFQSEKAHFLFNREGITLLWKSAISPGEAANTMSKSPPIPWDCVSRVFVREEKTKSTLSQNTQSIVIMLKDKQSKLRHLQILRFFAPKLITKRSEGLEFCLQVKGLAGENGKQNLYRALKLNLPDEVIDGSVKEVLNPTDVASYTKLWMDSFNTASSRQFEGSLAQGHNLCNGEYEIESFLGAGGQASVYLATSKSESFARRVVLKEFILPAHAGADVSQRSLANIQREFDLMKKLAHENIVKYHDIFVEDHRAYLVLEHVDGPSLRALVDQQGALPEKQVLQLAESMARILKHLHGQSPAIIHRDFTPENLILGRDGVLRLIDFNVAQELETEATRTIVGKHAYLPPEQFRGKATPQSDIYAFGASLFFMLTGMEPEPISCSHPILHDDTLSGLADDLVSKSTMLELDERFKSAEEILEAMASAISDHTNSEDIATKP